MKCDVILVAGGSGSRFGGPMPKQFELLHGRPMYLWSLDVFSSSEIVDHVVVVVPRDWGEPLRESLRILGNFKQIQVVAGGSSRQMSATLGLKALEGVSQNEWVMIHDAARPAISDELLNRVWEARNTSLPGFDMDLGGVIPGLPARETIKKVERHANLTLPLVASTLPRETLYVIQTPQLLKRGLLKEAYEKFEGFEAVDDASLIEKMGFKVVVVEGDYDNVKITFTEDRERVSDWLRKRRPQI